jgi:uncharacterized protein YjeT (DUF2065 family)
MSWRRWNWLNDIWLPLLLAVLRTCWLWPWLEIARRWLSPSQAETLLPMPLMIGLLLAGMAAARRALTGTGSLPRARLRVAGLGLAVVPAVLWWQFYHAQYPLWDAQWAGVLALELVHWSNEVPPPFITLLGTAYLWLQGMLDGRRPLDHDDIWRAFTAGFLALALAVAMATAGSGQLLASISRLILPFFAVGMAALALSGLKLVSKSVEQPDEARLKLNRYWLTSVFSVTVGLLGVGLLLSALVTPELVAHALSWTSIILNVLWQILLIVLLALSYLIFLFLEPLLNWLQTLARPEAPAWQIKLPDFQRQLEEMSKDTTPVSLTIGEWPRWIGLAGLILAIGVVFALALRRFWTGAEEDVEETRETVFSSDLLKAQLSELWRNWLERFKRTPTSVFDPFLSLEGEPATRRAVRAIYQALLWATRERGLPRARSQTPLEYQHTLEEALPGAQDALSTLTDGYLRARYAPQPPQAEHVEGVRQAWDRLRTTLEAKDGDEAEEDKR